MKTRALKCRWRRKQEEDIEVLSTASGDITYLVLATRAMVST